MVQESPIAQQDFVFLMQTGNKDLKKKLSQSVAGENVRLVTIEQSDTMGGQQVGGKIVSFIIGSDVEDPVRSAQRLHAMEKNAKIIILAKSQKNAEVFKQTIRFSPFLGSNVSCLEESEMETLDSMLRASLKAGKYRAIIEGTNSQLSFPDSARQQGFHQQFINKLMDIAPIGIAIVSGAGDVLGWNREAAAIFGKHEAQVLGTPLGGLFAGPERRKLERYIASTFNKPADDGPVENLELQRETIGDTGQVLTCTAALFNDTGEAGNVLVLTIKDITERVNEKKKREELQEKYTKNLENEIKQRTVALKHANEELLQKNDELENINKELEAFTYVSSHDLQEPLRKILTITDRILDRENQNLSDKGKKYLTFMQSTAGRMQTLIEDLLAFSRLQSSKRDFERTDIISTTEEVISDFKETIKEKDATIVAEGNCKADIVVFQYCQLMQNLISNALKFSRQDISPQIKIKCRTKNGSELKIKQLSPEIKYCHISVSDNGIGFEEKYSGKIFEVFERLHTRDEFPGSGIGLATVKKIVDLHNGVITVTSELNKGTTFDIYIPVQNSV
ncbi:hypothetical protein BH23BAC3_BH23BAC3_30780 [soil metagenome]